ncbi:MAG: FHA domain-containing protein [Planctomycetaceae bacterium]
MKLTFAIVRPDGRPPKPYTVEGGVIVFGRDEDCEVVLDHDHVSARHAQLQQNAGEWELHDLGSTNGTLVDGISLDGKATVKEDASVGFGASGPRLQILKLEQTEDAVIASERPDIGPASRLVTALVAMPSWMKPALLGLTVIIILGLGLFSLSKSGQPVVTTSYDVPSSDETEVNGATDEVADAKQVRTIAENQKDVIAAEAEHQGGPPETPDPSAIADTVRNQVVWIGLKSTGPQTGTYPFCSGWAASPTMIITSATMAESLIKMSEATVVVYNGSGAVSDVSTVILHPQFDPSDPGGNVSRHYNVAALHLEQPLPGLTSVSVDVERNPDTWRRVLAVKDLVFCGYDIPQDRQPLEIGRFPEFRGSHGRISSKDPGPDPLNSVPLIIATASRESTSSAHGQLVVSATGKIVGTRVHISKKFNLVIPIDRIRELQVAR